MSKRNRSSQPKTEKQEKELHHKDGSNTGVIIGAVISASAIVIAALIAYFGSVKPTSLTIEATRTAEALHTSIAMTTQAYLISLTDTPTASLTPTPTLSPTSTPSLTNTPMPLDHIDYVDLLEMAPQIGEGGDFWFFKNVDEEVFMFSPNENGSQFYIYTNPACTHSGTLGLKIDYSILEPDFAGWGLEWDTSPTTYFDASSFTKLVFWIKGNTGGDPFQISLTDLNNRVDDKQGFFEIKLRDYPIIVSSDIWTKIEIPLTDFKGVDTSALTQLSVTFYAKNGPGNICIDDIAFQ